jgi:hypothetical protein
MNCLSCTAVVALPNFIQERQHFPLQPRVDSYIIPFHIYLRQRDFWLLHFLLPRRLGLPEEPNDFSMTNSPSLCYYCSSVTITFFGVALSCEIENLFPCISVTETLTTTFPIHGIQQSDE